MCLPAASWYLQPRRPSGARWDFDRHQASRGALAHKTEVGGVTRSAYATRPRRSAAEAGGLSDTLLIEEMFTDESPRSDRRHRRSTVRPGVGPRRRRHFTEILADSGLLPPWTRASVESALQRLSVRRLLNGYRGKLPPTWRRPSTPFSRSRDMRPLICRC
jgi:hypothetical protein